MYRRFERTYCLSLQEITPQERHGLQWAAGSFFGKDDDKIKSSEYTQFNTFVNVPDIYFVFRIIQ
jgi:hypothetical protein